MILDHTSKPEHRVYRIVSDCDVIKEGTFIYLATRIGRGRFDYQGALVVSIEGDMLTLEINSSSISSYPPEGAQQVRLVSRFSEGSFIEHREPVASDMPSIMPA